MKSRIGRNVHFFCERYNAYRLDVCQHNTPNFSAVVSKFNEGNIDPHLRVLTRCAFELLMFRDGLWPLSILTVL